MSDSITPCIECGSMISSSAQQCPKCKAKEPHGVRCQVCGKQLKHKNAICGGEYNQYFYHIECINMVLSIPKDLNCPDCKTSLGFLTPLLIEKKRLLPPCPQCGANPILGRTFFTECNVCRLPIYGEIGRHLRSGTYHEDYKYYHEICAENPYVKQKIAQDDKILEQDRRTHSSGCLSALFCTLGILACTIIIFVLF